MILKPVSVEVVVRWLRMSKRTIPKLSNELNLIVIKFEAQSGVGVGDGDGPFVTVGVTVGTDVGDVNTQGKDGFNGLSIVKVIAY